MALTSMENFMRILNHQTPEYVPNFRDVVLMSSPSIMNNQGQPGIGGKDWFGVNWLVADASGNGAIHDPNQHLVYDITKWRDIIEFPDIDAMDWAAAYEKDFANIDRTERFTMSNAMDGNFNRLQSLMGTCEALMALLDEPEAVMDFFEENTRFKIRLIEKMAKYYKLDILINGDDVCSSTGLMFNRQIYNDMIKPFEKRIAQAGKDNGMMVFHHVCGKCEDIIPDILETCAIVVEPMQGDMNDIGKMKELYGGKIIFCGGWDVYGPHNSIDATEEIVRAEVRKRLDMYAKDGLFFFGGGMLLGKAVPQQVNDARRVWVSGELRAYSEKLIKENLK